MTESIIAPERLSKVTKTNVRKLLSDYEAYSLSAQHTTALRALITEAGKASLGWKMLKARHNQVELPGVPEVEKGKEELEDYFGDSSEAEEALKKLLRELVEPASKAKAQDDLNDSSLALPANLPNFEDIGEKLNEFVTRADSATTRGTSVTVALRAFNDIFLKNYPSLASQVKAEKPRSLGKAQSVLAGLMSDLDEGAQRVRNYDTSNNSTHCYACRKSFKRKVQDRITPPIKDDVEPAAGSTKRRKSDKKKTHQEKPKGPCNPSKAQEQQEDANKGRGPSECLGCGREMAECKFGTCDKGPWIVGSDFKIRHATGNQAPHKKTAPCGLRKFCRAGSKYGGKNEDSDEGDNTSQAESDKSE